jgi:hypothetical protein
MIIINDGINLTQIRLSKRRKKSMKASSWEVFFKKTTALKAPYTITPPTIIMIMGTEESQISLV